MDEFKSLIRYNTSGEDTEEEINDEENSNEAEEEVNEDEVIEEDRTRYNLILRNVTIDKKYEFIGFIK